MPEISADKVIGKTLVTLKRVPVFHNCTDKTPMYYIAANKVVGVVSTYLQRSCNNQLYWQIGKRDFKNDPFDRAQKTFVVKHEKGAFKVTGEIKSEIEKEQKEQKGLFQFYVDRYLPWIGGFLLLAIVLKNKIK